MTDGVPYSSELPKRSFNQERRPNFNNPSRQLGIKADPSAKYQLDGLYPSLTRTAKVRKHDDRLRGSDRERSTCGQVSEDYFEVRVDERAVGGRVKKRLLEILAEHFNVPKSRITILKGTKQETKQAK